jgi:hypothetical protein
MYYCLLDEENNFFLIFSILFWLYEINVTNYPPTENSVGQDRPHVLVIETN